MGSPSKALNTMTHTPKHTWKTISKVGPAVTWLQESFWAPIPITNVTQKNHLNTSRESCIGARFFQEQSSCNVPPQTEPSEYPRYHLFFIKTSNWCSQVEAKLMFKV